MFLCVFFFKQKTAYEMRISDWSSDVALPIAGEQFRHRRLFHGFASGVQQGGGGEGQASRGFDGGRHVGELERHRLMVDQPVAEGLALLDIVARGFERRAGDPHALGCRRYARSEEHTSELQSLMRISYVVFCLINITN